MSVQQQDSQNRTTSNDAVISLEGLTRYFGHRRVVDQVSLIVPRGSVFALLGRNGSGKTTTIRMLLGLLEPTRGRSSILGCDSQDLRPALRARIGYMAESHPSYSWMTVGQCRDHQAQFYTRWNEEMFAAIIDHFRLDPGVKAGALSRGERAGLALALTLAPEPEVLILDDPALGLDPVARRWLLEALVFATRDAGRTILFSSHLLEDVERVADHVAVLDRSALRVACSMEEFRAHVRQFVLHFAQGAPRAAIPPFPGLLRVRRFEDEVRLTVANPDAAILTVIGALGATSIQESSLGFEDAVIGYLGDRGERAFSVDDSMSLRDAGSIGAGT